jgi:serine/threonine protein kinase
LGKYARCQVTLSMLQKGSVIQGKWTKHNFQLVRRLGAGANGQVYLVRSNNGLYAMKIHDRSGDIALEWGILEQMHRISGYFPDPVMIDDCVGLPLYFYLMGWINGQTLDSLHIMNPSRIRDVLIQILSGLHELHQTSHAYCDIKPQNILLEEMSGVSTVRFVDVGGVTPFGRSVRQFTPYYDRAFWNLGSRNADAHYDICAVVLMFICLYSPPPKNLSEFTDKHRYEWLQRALNSFPIHSYMPLFRTILDGKITESRLFLDKLSQIPIQNAAYAKAMRAGRQGSMRRVSKKIDWTERVMWGSICFAAVSTLAAWASFFGWF